MRRIAILTIAAALALKPQTSSKDPARLLADSQSLAQPNLLPLVYGETAVVFRGVPGESNFNLHSYVAHHDGLLWVVWSSSRNREEDPDQMIRYATSRDGVIWTSPRILAADPDGPDKPARWIARGVFVENGRLRALGAYIESADYGRRGRDVVWRNLRLVLFEWTGTEWSARGTYASDCMNNFPPQRLGGVYAMPCRDSRMKTSTWLSPPNRKATAGHALPLPPIPHSIAWTSQPSTKPPMASPT